MQVKNYTDPAGVQFREIISRKYATLKSLEAEYKKKGNRTWVNPYNLKEGQWMLTVKIGEVRS